MGRPSRITDPSVVSAPAGQCEPNQVQFIKECVKTSPGLRVTGSYGPLMEERTSLSTSLSESHHKAASLISHVELYR